MKERPILFRPEMVRAILAGRKTQTRRVVKPDASWTAFCNGNKAQAFTTFHREVDPGDIWQCGDHWQCGDDRLPQNYQAGDCLWVRESFAGGSDMWTPRGNWKRGASHEAIYYADNARRMIDCDRDRYFWLRRHCLGQRGWTPNIHMPRWASRITLEITAVRVERLHAISDADCYAEGITDEDVGIGLSNAAYLGLWERINGRESVDLNPWVWVVEFRHLQNTEAQRSPASGDKLPPLVRQSGGAS